MDHWNHLLFGDLVMLQRLLANQVIHFDAEMIAHLPMATSVNDTFVSTVSELNALRSRVDVLYLLMVEQLTEVTCAAVVRYTTTDGQLIERRVGEFCQHVFNHQTHHRGQLSCVLSQFGVSYGCTDLPIVVPEGAR